MPEGAGSPVQISPNQTRGIRTRSVSTLTYMHITGSTGLIYSQYYCPCRRTGRSPFEMEATFRRSSVRVRNWPLCTSCIRHPRPQASTAHGGACCTACQSDLPICRDATPICICIFLTIFEAQCLFENIFPLCSIPQPTCIVLRPSKRHA